MSRKLVVYSGYRMTLEEFHTLEKEIPSFKAHSKFQGAAGDVLDDTYRDWVQSLPRQQRVQAPPIRVVRDRDFFKANGSYEGVVGNSVEESDEESSDEEEDDNAEDDNVPITHYFFTLRCILYRRAGQLDDPNDPDGPKVRTETDQDRTVRDNLVTLLRSLGAKTVSPASFEFYYDLGYRNFPLTKQARRLRSPMANQRTKLTFIGIR